MDSSDCSQALSFECGGAGSNTFEDEEFRFMTEVFMQNACKKTSVGWSETLRGINQNSDGTAISSHVHDVMNVFQTLMRSQHEALLVLPPPAQYYEMMCRRLGMKTKKHTNNRRFKGKLYQSASMSAAASLSVGASQAESFRDRPTIGNVIILHACREQQDILAENARRENAAEVASITSREQRATDQLRYQQPHCDARIVKSRTGEPVAQGRLTSSRGGDNSTSYSSNCGKKEHEPETGDAPSSQRLITLDLSQQYLGSRGLLAFIVTIPQLTFLQSLSVSRTMLDSVFVVVLCRALRHKFTPHLQSLDISYNPAIGSVGAAAALELIKTHNTNICILRTDGIEMVPTIRRQIDECLKNRVIAIAVTMKKAAEDAAKC